MLIPIFFEHNCTVYQVLFSPICTCVHLIAIPVASMGLDLKFPESLKEELPHRAVDPASPHQRQELLLSTHSHADFIPSILTVSLV